MIWKLVVLTVCGVLPVVLGHPPDEYSEHVSYCKPPAGLPHGEYRDKYKTGESIHVQCANYPNIFYTMVCTDHGSWLEHKNCKPKDDGKPPKPKPRPDYPKPMPPKPMPPYNPEEYYPKPEEYQPKPDEYVPPSKPKMPEEYLPNPAPKEQDYYYPNPKEQTYPPATPKEPDHYYPEPDKPQPAPQPDPTQPKRCQFRPAYMHDGYRFYQFNPSTRLEFRCPGTQTGFIAFCGNDGKWYMPRNACPPQQYPPQPPQPRQPPQPQQPSQPPQPQVVYVGRK